MMQKNTLFMGVGLFLIYTDGAVSMSNCGKGEYDKCVRMADPLLTDAHMIFPDNMVDIDSVCRKWTLFIDCVKRYIDNCFTEHRKQQFHQAVETPVSSVHQMCSSTTYQAEYLQHATCLKNTLTDDRYCGRHYKYLATQVQGNRDMERDDLCCAHHRFRECVLTETRRNCDNKFSPSSKMMPSAFSRQVLDKALSFLREQCSEYSPNPGECMGYQPTSNRVDQSADELTDTTHVIGPSYSISHTHSGNDMSDSTNPLNTIQSNEPDLPVTMNPLTWIPSRDGRRRTTELEADSTSNEPSTRSSYGRGVTWEPTMPRDDLFKATHYKPSTEAWYPGNNINFQKDVEDLSSNTVEEPNQQGLAHFNEDSSVARVTASIAILVIQTAVLFYLL